MNAAFDGGTSARFSAERSTTFRADAAAVAAIAAGCLALAARPVSWAAFGVTLTVGAVGALHPLCESARESRREWLATVVVGVSAFAFARGMLRGTIPATASATLLGTSILAAVAEEAFFRRLVYGRLLRRGVALAVAGSAVLFALVHVPGYGLRAMPVNVAAALLLGWQRWATGSWTAPAATHAAANVLMVL